MCSSEKYMDFEPIWNIEDIRFELQYDFAKYLEKKNHVVHEISSSDEKRPDYYYYFFLQPVKLNTSVLSCKAVKIKVKLFDFYKGIVWQLYNNFKERSQRIVEQYTI